MKAQTIKFFTMLVFLLLISGMAFSQTEYTLAILIRLSTSHDTPTQGSIYIDPLPPEFPVYKDRQITYSAHTQVTLFADDMIEFFLCPFVGEGARMWTFKYWGGDWPDPVDKHSGTILMDKDKTVIAYYEFRDSGCPSPPPATPAPTPRISDPELGDVNQDDAVDILDALLVAQYYVGLPVNINMDVADTDCSGSVDILDALLIAQFYVKIISEFCL